MFSKFRESLDKLDDERFLADAATPESRKQKIAKLRRARSLQMLVLIFMGSCIIFMICIYPAGDLSMVFILTLFPVISLLAADFQIKMLLLFEQTQPKG